jgi:hypothetical protein
MNANQMIFDAISDGGKQEVLLLLMESLNDAIRVCQESMDNPDHDDEEFWRNQLSLVISHCQDGIVAASQDDLKTACECVRAAQREEMRLDDDIATSWPFALVSAISDHRGLIH